MNFNFQDIEVRTTKNKRKAGAGFTRKQAFHGLKYQVKNNGDDKFTVSNTLWESLGLEENALMFGRIGDNVFVGVVDYDHKMATLFTKPKGEKKSKTTIATTFRDDLIAVGLISEVDIATIEKNKPNLQFLTVEAVEGEGIPEGVSAMYRIVADETVGAEAEADEVEASNDEAAPQTEDPQEEAAPQEVDADEDF